MKLFKPSILGLLLILFTLSECTLWEPERLDLACPIISSIAPNKAHFNEIITIKGENFIANEPSFHKVLIGNTEVSSEDILEVPDAQTLKFRVPKGIGSGKISVELKNSGSCGTSSDVDFFYLYTSTATVFAGTANNNSCTNCLNSPRGLDVDSDGNVYLADRGNHVIIKITPSATLSIYAGVKGVGTFKDDPDGLNANFRSPNDVAVDAAKNVYVADETNQCIRKIFNNSSHSVTIVAGKAGSPGNINQTTLLSARYTRPAGICIGQGGKIYVSEVSKNRVRELDVNPGPGFDKIIIGDSLGTAGDLKTPMGLFYTTNRTGDGPLYLADQGNKAIKSIAIPGFVVKKMLPAIIPAPYNSPSDVVVAEDGILFGLDQSAGRIVAIYPGNDGVFDVLEPGFNFNRLSSIAIFKNVLYVSDEVLHIVVKIVLE